jgi:hypothetical protein
MLIHCCCMYRSQGTSFTMIVAPSGDNSATDLSSNLGGGGTLLADALGIPPSSIEVLSEPQLGGQVEVFRCPADTGARVRLV